MKVPNVYTCERIGLDIKFEVVAVRQVEQKRRIVDALVCRRVEHGAGSRKIEACPIEVSTSISRSARKNGTGSGAKATWTVNQEGRSGISSASLWRRNRHGLAGGRCQVDRAAHEVQVAESPELLGIAYHTIGNEIGSVASL